ncbi:cobalamin-binding protein [Turneriella parva]|uniref:ABC-type transporter, periplasmic subunit n=1 Tax=Turneriella parva (strain ATCC BAA-1111 / DSM 21527 / NCTC 11395 / H) TaxID=869212 RepID=I4B838_TURPD|nr:cobalamin-binding protein [Turneriella parva]AFM13445.1 ABC-type transporter, periplasmic subunit [Turneriella parva DSM 21527]
MASPERIVCLTEETCEWLYLLGEEQRIVGISAYTVRPERAPKEKPKVSAFLTGNIRKIKGLAPDLVIGFSDIQSELAAKLIKEGLTVLITNQRSLQEIDATLMQVARLVGKEALGARLLNRWHRKADAIRSLTSGRKRPRVFFQEWNEPVISAIRWVTELIEICGGENIFAARSAAMAKDRIVTLAAVKKHDPEVIIGSWCGKPVDFEWIRSRPELAKVTAVVNDKLFEIESAEILQPGPALYLDGINRIYAAIHGQELPAKLRQR